MITQGSRYTNSAVTTAIVNGKPAKVIVPGTPQPLTVSFTTYIVTEGDTPDLLANQFYSDPTLWWRIADANPEILWWGSISPGTRLRIPTTAA